MTIPLSKVAEALRLPDPGGALVTGWSVDSRTIQRGDLFFALQGPSHDGHRFLAQVRDKGAVAAVGQASFPVEDRPEGLPYLAVPDTQVALETLASWIRQRWGRDLVAVTGSAGKTTTKDIIAAFLSVEHNVGKTIGNLNNHVGLPLSLLRLPDDSDMGVFELGMNHAGEIAALAHIAKPQVGVVTNVGYAHVENFESIEEIASAKRELIEALPPEGIAVLNADDERVSRFAAYHHGRVVTYGFSHDATVRAENVEFSTTGVRFAVGGTQLESRLSGRHALSNLLAGVAVASIYEIAPERLVDAARALEPGKMRGERIVRNGILHFDDCYNSNPDAARAMVDLLAETPARRRIAVLGEMLELGRLSEPLHRDLGFYVARSGLNVLVGIRGAARHAVDAAIAAGLPADAACFFEDPVSAGDWLRGIAMEGDAILWKGSRGTRVELALEKFLG